MIAIGISSIPAYTRVVRGSVLSVKENDYVMAARAQGAGLSFIGLGPSPPVAEWGAMLAGSRVYIRRAWWLMLFPGLAITLSVLAINMLGDGLRDALDPQLK